MSVTISEVLSTEALSHFDDTTKHVHGLPSGAYVDQQFYDLENDELFPNTWTFVGFAHELANSGDVYPVKVGRKPVFLVRTKEGGIKAFHNVCSHRCATLVEEKGNVGRFLKCPYHAWVYDLNGDLRTAPHFGGPDKSFPDGFDTKELNLKEVPCTVWLDWIFVNVNGNAPSFEEYASPLMERLDGIDFENLKPIASLDFGEVDTNWKFLMENFIEPYHVQFVHSTTTDQPLLDHYTIVDGNCMGSAVDISREGEQTKQDALGVSSRYLTLFPNFVFGWYFPDQMGVHLNVPVGPGKTHQRRVLYYKGDQELSPAAIEGLKALWFKVHKEDHEICERLQEGRASNVAENGGVLSPYWEDSVRHFQQMVMGHIR